MKILRDYQKEGRDHLLQTGVGGCLFMEMRLGKSLTALRYVKRLLWKEPKSKILIIAPNSTFKSWIEDIKEEKLSYLIVKGSAQKKEQILQQKATIYLLNKEGYRKGKRINGDLKYKPLTGLLETNWLAVILDESHFIKNPKSAVSKFMVKNFTHVEYKLCLTGTPMENNELDFFQQYKFILGKKLNLNYWNFRNYYTKTVAYQTFITKKGKAFLKDISKEITFSLRRKDVNLDKEKIFEVRTIELPASARKIYNRVVEDFVLEYNTTRRITKFIIEQYSILRRICGGFLPAEEENSEAVFLHEAKLKELYSLITENFQDEPILIFATFTAEIELIYNFLKKKKMSCEKLYGKVKIGEDRWKLERAFKKREFNIFIVQPTTVKEGVDLSTASTSIYYSLPRGYITWKQSQDRILSLQKNDSLLIIILEIENSVESDLWKKLEKKTSQEDTILSALNKLSFK